MFNKVRPSFLIPIIIVLIAIIAYSWGQTRDDGLTITRVLDTFSDVDGDGDDDYIITADVVLNGSTNFLLMDESGNDIVETDEELYGGEPIGPESGGGAPQTEFAAVFTIFRVVDEPLMSSGESYADWQNKAAGCPDEFPYWTTITLPGDEVFTCLHRSGLPYYKQLDDGEIYIQLLIDSLPVPLDTRVKVKVTYP